MFFKIEKDGKFYCIDLSGNLANDMIASYREKGYLVSPISDEQELELILTLETMDGVDVDVANDYAKEQMA